MQVHKIMNDPVFIGGKTYERSAIEKWLEESDKCPLTNKELASKELTPNDDKRSEIFEFMASVIKKVLDLLPKLMNKDHFRQAEELLDHADAYNKTLKNAHSREFIDKLNELIPDLIQEKQEEHLNVAKLLLDRSEDHNFRLGADHETTIKILRLWISFGETKKDDDLTEKKQLKLIELLVEHKMFQDAAKVYLELKTQESLLTSLELTAEQLTELVTTLKRMEAPKYDKDAFKLAVATGDH